MPRSRLYDFGPVFTPQPRNLIQSPDVGRRLAKHLQLKERQPAPSLAPEVYPVVVVADLATSSPDDIEINRPAMDCISIPYLATDVAITWQLQNPPDSQALIVVQRILVADEDGHRFTLHETNLDIFIGATLGTPHWRHTGIRPNLTTAARHGAAFALAGSGVLASARVQAGVSYDLLRGGFDDWILTPGNSLRLMMTNTPSTAGTAEVTWSWYERKLVP